MSSTYRGAPHVSTDFSGLPARVQDDLRAIRSSYPVLAGKLEAILAGPGDNLAKSESVQALFNEHIRAGTSRLARFVHAALPVYISEAESMLHGAHRLAVKASTRDVFYAQLHGQMFGPDEATSLRVRQALAGGGDPRAAAYGFQRTDGSKISLDAAGQARVRTAVNTFQAETQLARYRDSSTGVTHVQFLAGGRCTYKGEGGTCTDLDGEVFPVDAIPGWARIPRHPYSNSRWLPVVNAAPGVDTGGPAAKGLFK